MLKLYYYKLVVPIYKFQWLVFENFDDEFYKSHLLLTIDEL